MRIVEWREKMRICIDLTMWQLMQLCFCLLSTPILQRHTLAAIDWTHVKPLHLVSMPQRTLTSSLTSSSSASSASSASSFSLSNETLDETDEYESSHEPKMNINPAEKPLLEDEPIMAMDRIYGGDVATRICFPYQVGLLLQRPRGLYWCGGSLISDEFVLTAAHCVDKAKRALVFLGALEIKNAKEVGQVRMMVNQSNFIIFPTWNARRLKDDIALVRLPVPIEFNERIYPIPLPKRSYVSRSFTNKLAIASGWGRYATGVHSISGVLRFVKLRIVDGETCQHSFPLSYRSTNICTSGKHAKSTCNGDSGGPLVLQRKLSKERVLVGITSFGSIFGCDRGFPAAFTKVAAYLDWISDEAGVEPDEGWNPDAQLYEHSSNITNCRDYCAELDTNDDIEEEDDDEEYNENVNIENHDTLLYRHEQRYSDGTLLRTQIYHG